MIVRAHRREIRTFDECQWKVLMEEGGYKSKISYKLGTLPGFGPILKFSKSNMVYGTDGQPDEESRVGQTSTKRVFRKIFNKRFSTKKRSVITLDRGIYRVLTDAERSIKNGTMSGYLNVPGVDFEDKEKKIAQEQYDLTLAFAVRTLSHERIHDGAFRNGVEDSPNGEDNDLERGNNYERGVYGSVSSYSDFGYALKRYYEHRLNDGNSHDENSTNDDWKGQVDARIKEDIFQKKR
jgi:hypothetical protein